MVFSGYCEQALPGQTFLSDFHPDQRVLGVFPDGSNKVSCARYWNRWRETLKNVAELIYRNAL
jgi:hypothetical protein